MYVCFYLCFISYVFVCHSVIVIVLVSVCVVCVYMGVCDVCMFLPLFY